MNLDIEYGVRSGIRNSQVVREVDTRQRREMRRIVLLAGLSVGLVLFSAGQASRYQGAGMRIETLRVERAEERIHHRQLKAAVEVLESGDDVEAMAASLGMRRAELADTVVLERTIDTTPSGGVLALAR